jgi:hypothetical protein
MLELAKTCGVSVATSRVETIGGKDVLLVKRFDREKTDKGYQRARMISGLMLLRAEEAAEMGTGVLGPNHDWSSHAADGFGLMCIYYDQPDSAPPPRKRYSGNPSRSGGSWQSA